MVPVGSVGTVHLFYDWEFLQFMVKSDARCMAGHLSNRISMSFGYQFRSSCFQFLHWPPCASEISISAFCGSGATQFGMKQQTKKKRLNDFEHFNLYHQCSAVSVWNVWLKYKLQTLSWCWNSAFVLQCEFSSVNVQECSRCIARHLSKRWFENVLWTAFFNVPCLHLAIN